MKNIIKVLLVVMALVLVIAAFTACEPEQPEVPEVPEVPENPTPEVCTHENIEFVLGKAPTCTEDGLTSGFKCKDCGEWTAPQEVDPAGHDYTIDVEVDATCTDPGYTEKKCARCDATTDHKVIEPYGHKIVDIKGKAATCTENGLTEGKKCSVCNAILVKQEVIPAGHKPGEDGVCEVCHNVPVSTADELIEALEAGKNVILMNDIVIDPANMSNAYGTTGLNIKKGQSLDGNGFVLDIHGAGGTWDSGVNTTGGVIKNIKVTGAFRGVFVNHTSDHSEQVVLENVVIEGTTYTISCDQGMQQTLKAVGSTFNGWTSYAATLGSAEFVDCKFGEGNGYAYCRPYSETTFTNCVFEEGYAIDATLTTLTFVNCYVGETLVTAENVVELLGEGAASIVFANN